MRGPVGGHCVQIRDREGILEERMAAIDAGIQNAHEKRPFLRKLESRQAPALVTIPSVLRFRVIAC